MQQDAVLKLVLEYLNDIDLIVHMFKVQYGDVFNSSDTASNSPMEEDEEEEEEEEKESKAEQEKRRFQRYVENRNSHDIKPSEWKRNDPGSKRVSPWELMLLSSSSDYCCSICSNLLTTHNLVKNNDLYKAVLPAEEDPVPDFLMNIILGYVDINYGEAGYSMICNTCVWKYKLNCTLLKSIETKIKIIKKQSYRCASCKTLISPSFNIDHIIPKSEFGSNLESNKHAVCSNCHYIKTKHEKVVHGKTGYKTCNSQFAKNLSKQWIDRVKENLKR